MYLSDYELDTYTSEEFNKAYATIRASLTAGRIANQEKCTIILGGQPGAGKSTFYQMRDDLDEYIAINGDEFRRFHPNYKSIIKTDMEHYAERTQSFSNQVVEALIEDLGGNGYNLIIEGTLRNPDVPIHTCELLQGKGYQADLVVIACDAETAWKSTIERAERQKAKGIEPRLVPIDIYNRTVHQVADSLSKIEDRKCFDSITIMDREGCILFGPQSVGQRASDILSRNLNLENWENKYPEYERAFIQIKIDLLKSRLEKTRNDGLER